MQFLRKNDLITKKQFGFIGGRSTILQLLNVLDTWTEILDRGGYVDVIYCDFQKAFDTVPHNRLLEVLVYYGIKDPVLSWIRDFLSHRCQQVAVNGKLSSLFEVTSGVPQGSVLGPLLFIIFINIMVEKAETENLYLYADDLKLFNEVNEGDDVENLQYSLDRLYDWTQFSLLKFHPDKCKVMRLKPPRSIGLPITTNYGIDDVRLEIVTKEKDLGIIFDHTLSFEEHITAKVNKANSLMGMLRRSFTYMDKYMFKQLFISIVRPHLEYGAPVWNPHLKRLINLVENVQRRATKLIPCMKNLSYKKRLKSLDLPTLKYRRYRGDMIETYKMAHEVYNKEACQFLTFERSNASGHDLRGHNLKLSNSRYRGDTRKFSFSCRVSQQWNNLPDNVVNAPSLNAFKNRLDNLWKIEDIMYCPDIDLHENTSSRQTQYVALA